MSDDKHGWRNRRHFQGMLMMLILMIHPVMATEQNAPPVQFLSFPDVARVCEGPIVNTITAPSGTITLSEIAERIKPTLWFSPDEPLLRGVSPDVNTTQPSSWPTVADGKIVAGTSPTVYYRVTEIKASGTDNDLASKLERRACTIGDPRTTKPVKDWVNSRSANPECIATYPWDVEALLEVSWFRLRYLFYYPSEVGTGSHLNDLEALDVDLKLSRVDRPISAPRCVDLRVATVYGSAHGLGLFTNVLDFDAVMGEYSGLPSAERGNDPADRLIVLVEEGKHASAVDRNGDGYFTPGFDTNRHVSDAWGVRDVMRGNVLTPQFRAEMFKPRERNLTAGAKRLRRYSVDSYQLRRPTQSEDMRNVTLICGVAEASVSERQAAMRAYARNLESLQPNRDGPSPQALLTGKRFCDDTEVLNHINGNDVGAFLGLGGAYNDFTRWWERLSVGLRMDRGFGWTTTIPRGVAVRGVGGWIVGKLSGPWPGHEAPKSFDVLYMPSASRFLEPYGGLGVDWDAPETDHRGQMSVELGLRTRVPWGSFFLGGRIGVRANIVDETLGNGRLVFEFGGGVW